MDRSRLTEVQLQIVDASPGRIVFLGGAGSGKSTIVIERAIMLLESGQARPEQILLLAPSRRAAVGLGRRVHDRLAAGGELGRAAGHGLTATSFHGLALAILRRHYRQMGYARPPDILGIARHYHFLRAMLDGENPALWPNYRGGRHGRSLLGLAYRIVMGIAENGLNEAELRRRARAWGQPELEDFAAFATRYRQHLKAAGLVDFGQLLSSVIELLSTDRDIAASYHGIHRHILVDEFEQANLAQAAMVYHLLGAETDMLVAGDPAQSINSYQSGAPSRLLDFPERVDARVIVSSEDHRGRERIARLGATLRPSMPGLPTFAPRANDPPSGQSGGESQDDAAGYAVLRQFTYQSQEAHWIGSEVASLLRAGAPPSAIAILFRSISTPVVDLIASELTRRRVPFLIQRGASAGGDPLARGAINLLRYLLATCAAAPPDASPALALGHAPANASGASDSGDAASDRAESPADLLLRVLDSPIAGLPAFGVRELRRALALAQRDIDRLETDGTRELRLREELRAALEAFFDRVAALRRALGSSASSLLWEMWRRFPAFRDDALAEGGGSAALHVLLDEVESIEEHQGFLGLEEFIALVDGGYFDHVGPLSRGDAKGGVLITTIHQARGQEWDVVFLPSLIEGVLPSQRSPLDVGPILAAAPPDVERDSAAAAAHLSTVAQRHHLAEERRVFYVAVSRSHQGLYLSYSQRAADGRRTQHPSRFLLRLAECPGVEVVPGDGNERLPSDVDGAVIHYRRLLCSNEPLHRVNGLYGLAAIRARWPEAVRPAEWWSNVAETSGAAPPFPTRRLSLSASKLGAYRDCPLAYQFGYHWRLGEAEGPALTIGTILHSVLEEYHRPDSELPRTREALSESLERHFDASTFRYRPIARQARRNLEDMLDKYFDRYGQSNEVAAVERRFSFDFGPHRVTGFIDRVDRLPDGALELIDYKSGQPMSKSEAEDDLQLALYDLAFFHDDALRSFGRAGLVSYVYPKSIGPRADGKRSYAPSDESRERLRARVSLYADAILEERFPSHAALAETFPDLDPGELDRALRKDPCRFCSFGWVCPEMERRASDE